MIIIVKFVLRNFNYYINYKTNEKVSNDLRNGRDASSM